MGTRKIRNYVNGQWVEPRSSHVADVVNPATGQLLAQLPLTTGKETEGIIPSLAASRALAEVIKRAPASTKDTVFMVLLSGANSRDNYPVVVEKGE